VQAGCLLAGRVGVTHVVDERFEPVGPIEDYLAHLQAIERSPNTVRALRASLRLFFEHLGARGVAWTPVRLDDIGRFVSFLRAPAGDVVVIDASISLRARRRPFNRHLAVSVRPLRLPTPVGA